MEDDPSSDVDAFEFLGGLRAEYARMTKDSETAANDVDAVRKSIEASIAEGDYEDAEIVRNRLRQRYGETDD